MTIMNVNRSRFKLPVSEQPLVLRSGQIVQGEILKIYPQNKAEIQIGSSRFIAEINTSLMVGKKYFFQVNETSTQLIQLKVIGDSFKQDVEQNFLQLLDKLGLKKNRHVVDLVRMLFTEKIAFNRQQLTQAIHIIDSLGFRQDTKSIIKDMFLKRLPISENVFHALNTMRQYDSTRLMTQLLHDLRTIPHSNETEKQLQLLLEQLLSRPGKTEVYIPNDQMERNIHRNEFQSMLFQQSNNFMLRDSTVISRKRYISQLTQLLYLGSLGVPGAPGTENKTLSMKQLSEITTKLRNEMPILKANAEQILNQFHSFKSESAKSNPSFALQTLFQEKISPYLPESMRNSITFSLQLNTQVNEAEIYQYLRLFANDSTYQMLEGAVKNIQNEAFHSHTMMKTNLLFTMQQFIQKVGMLDENQIKVNIEKILAHQTDQPLKQHETIKSLLIQMLQEGKQPLNEKIQSLLHLINGLQLQSVQESQNTILATLQLPGEKFSLPKDLFFQFEGKKTEDGKLDPNYCRILFVLDLQHIKETVIDMFVQKRVVTLTIYNDIVKNAQYKRDELISLLKEQLSGLDFRLSTLTWKPLSEHKEEIKSIDHQQRDYFVKERIDFKI